VGDWLELKTRLQADKQNKKLWEEAIEFFDKRLHSRYLQPIKVIENNSNIEGEGFSIVAILCSMIEALESFYQGRTYRKGAKGNPLDEKVEYYKSLPIFKSFLTNRDPFKNLFSLNGLVEDFYENVRCAILHEAATRNGWTIRVDTEEMIEVNGYQKILNRALFVKEIENYMGGYILELSESTELKDAYIRKFDSICVSV